MVVKHCVTASKCGTDTFSVAQVELDIGPGDEVITTQFAFTSTSEMIALIGATPVFVDINPNTDNIDSVKIEMPFHQKQNNHAGALCPKLHFYTSESCMSKEGCNGAWLSS